MVLAIYGVSDPETLPRAQGLRSWPKGPGAQDLSPFRARGLGDQASISVLTSISDLPRVLAGVLSYVQFQSLLFGSKIFCSVPKSSVQCQSLLFSSKVFCSVL